MKSAILAAVDEPGFPPAAAGAAWMFSCARCRRLRRRVREWLTGTSPRFEARCRMVAARRVGDVGMSAFERELLRQLAEWERAVAELSRGRL